MTTNAELLALAELWESAWPTLPDDDFGKGVRQQADACASALRALASQPVGLPELPAGWELTFNPDPPFPDIATVRNPDGVGEPVIQGDMPVLWKFLAALHEHRTYAARAAGVDANSRRYDWIRKNLVWRDWHGRIMWSVEIDMPEPSWTDPASDFDNAIDAAISEQAGAEG